MTDRAGFDKQSETKESEPKNARQSGSSC